MRGAIARTAGVTRFGIALLAGILSVSGITRDSGSSGQARRYTALFGGTETAWRDFTYHFWDPGNAIPRLRPTGGDGGIRNDAPYPVFWHMAQASNVLFWRWKTTRSEPVREMIRSQFREMRSRYSDAMLSSAAWAGYRANSIINVEDDASWAIAYFCQVHEATGDPAALRIAEALTGSTYATYADPNHGGAGLLYAVPGQDPDHQGWSSGYEAVAARCAVYLFEQTSHGHLLGFAQQTWEWMHKYLRHPTGVYFAELDIRPSLRGAANPDYRKPVGWNRPGDIKRGGSITFLGGTMGMASLSAALYMVTGEAKYLDEVRSIVAGMTRQETFLRPGAAVGVSGDVIANERDGWTDGFTAPYLVSDALSLEGVDTDGKLKQALMNTALAVTKQRTSDGFYGADWSGPEWDPAHRWNTWAAQAGGGTGSGTGMASAWQMPTTSSSVSMVLAGEMVERSTSRKTEGG